LGQRLDVACSALKRAAPGSSLELAAVRVWYSLLIEVLETTRSNDAYEPAGMVSAKLIVELGGRFPELSKDGRLRSFDLDDQGAQRLAAWLKVYGDKPLLTPPVRMDEVVSWIGYMDLQSDPQVLVLSALAALQIYSVEARVEQRALKAILDSLSGLVCPSPTVEKALDRIVTNHAYQPRSALRDEAATAIFGCSRFVTEFPICLGIARFAALHSDEQSSTWCAAMALWRNLLSQLPLVIQQTEEAKIVARRASVGSKLGIEAAERWSVLVDLIADPAQRSVAIESAKMAAPSDSYLARLASNK
jgi:hypothetical protein